MKTLRADQAACVEQIREAVARGERRIVVQGPTGIGKGVIAVDIVERALAKFKRVLVTVPMISLVDQMVEVLAGQGIYDVGVIQAQHIMSDFSKPVQVASVQTLMRRALPEVDMVLVDEVHRWFNFFEGWFLKPEWRDVPIIGFSATPWTKGLGSWFNKLITINSIDRLIEQGVLVPFRTFAPDAPDLSGVRVVGGEFVTADLDEVMRPKRLVANIVETWQELGEGRSTVAFCCSRAHANQLREEFMSVGVSAAYLDCETPVNERKAVRADMLAGKVKVVCNVDVVGLGVDWPEVGCIIYARPTRSDMRFVQNIGRGLRSAPGKLDLIILDHSTTTQRLGFVNEVYDLHKALDDGRTKEKAPQVMALPKECPNCHYLKPPRAAVCANCGHKADFHADQVMVERGTLREISPGDDMKALIKRLPDKQHVYGQLVWWARQKGYKPGFAQCKVKEIFGSWCRDREPDASTVQPPVPALVEYLYIASEKWKRDHYNAKRRAQHAERRAGNNGNGHVNGKPRNPDVDHLRETYLERRAYGSALMNDRDFEDFRP